MVDWSGLFWLKAVEPRLLVVFLKRLSGASAGPVLDRFFTAFAFIRA
jgi:hypothetical protein